VTNFKPTFVEGDPYEEIDECCIEIWYWETPFFTYTAHHFLTYAETQIKEWACFIHISVSQLSDRLDLGLKPCLGDAAMCGMDIAYKLSSREEAEAACVAHARKVFVSLGTVLGEI